jgi:hypothetical protein
MSDEAGAACLGCLMILVITAALDVIAAWLTQWAWNLVLSPVFHWPHLDFLEAFALYVLLSLFAGLFRSSSDTSKKS